MSAPPLGALWLALLALLASSPTRADEPPPASAHAPEVVFVGPQALRLPPRISARERTLDLGLGELASRSSRHVLHGALQGTVGAGFVLAGALVHDEYARGLLILIGSGTLARGLIQLLLVPDASEQARVYRALPMFTADQVRARIAYGEQALAQLARAGRRTRIVDGTVTMCVASAYVPLLWWLARQADENHHFGDSSLDYVGLALSAISFGSGLAATLVESEAEERNREYQEGQRERERVAPRELEQLSLGPSERPPSRAWTAHSARRSALMFAYRAGGVQLGARVRF